MSRAGHAMTDNSPVKILALDVSSRCTGYAVGPTSGPVICGSARFPGHGDRIGGLLAHFRAWLSERVNKFEPKLIAFEQPIRPIGAANLLTMRQLYSLAGMVELVAQDHGRLAVEVNNGAHKKILYGRGGKKPAPLEAISLARLWGFSPTNGDEADACGVWLMAVAHTAPKDFRAWAALKERNSIAAGVTLI